MRVWKDALYPGRWHLPDGREFDCQPGDIEHYARRVQDMLAAGLHVPLAWEHQDVGPVPLSDAEKIAERTKLTMGHLTGSRVAPQGYLELQLEVPDEEDLKRLGKVRFVSPEIRHDYTDPSGKPWDGPSIYHVAATSRPIQYTQQPFMLSDPASAPIRLSLDGYRPIRLAGEDPWQPYKGEQGGQGWFHADTGEIRYQREKPSGGSAIKTQERKPQPKPQAKAKPKAQPKTQGISPANAANVGKQFEQIAMMYEAPGAPGGGGKGAPVNTAHMAQVAKQAAPDLTPKEFGEMLNALWDQGVIELQILNEVREAKPEHLAWMPRFKGPTGDESVMGFARSEDWSVVPKAIQQWAQKNTQLSQGEIMTKHRKPFRLADDDSDSSDSPDSSDKPETSAEQVSEEDRVQDVIAKLADLGIMLPDDTNKENFFDRVVGSLLTKAANNDEVPPPPPEEPAIEEDEPAPMPMGLSEQFRSLKHENQALKAHVMGLKRKDILRRIKALEGQVPASIYNDLASRAGKVQLSLAQNGELANNNFLVELSAYERVAKAASPFLRNSHNGHEEDVPLSQTAYVQPHGDDETADEMLGLIGRQRRKR